MEGSSGPSREQSGRPPLPAHPLSLTTSSLHSSRTSSPRDHQGSKPTLQALTTLKLEQYRAGARTFTEGSDARAGLSNGDVVAFQTQDGLFAVLALEAESDDPAAVHYALASSNSHSSSDVATHLEVVKQGKWLAFRAASSGDRFLQARKRSPRLVFYNNNIGTWEQWELLDETAAEQAPWARLAVKLKHRRLPQFELKVEVVRVGTFTPGGGGPASITPRSVTMAQQEPEVSENVQLKKMSGVLMHEWFNFVDREKQLRMHIAAQVTQLAEDAADLQAWTVSQVETIRQEMDEEVSHLLETIQRKSAKLEDTTARLTNRLRWGVAVLQAKNELAIKRQAFSAWRAMASRKRYCRQIVARLQQRAEVRLAGRAMEAWLEYHTDRQARQERLWLAVRRMVFIKMYHAFASWHDLVATKKALALQQQQLTLSSGMHMQRWRLMQVFAAWRERVSRCRQARSLLTHMASSAQQRLALEAFTAWRQFTQQQQVRVESLAALVAARRRHQALQEALCCWREAVDTKHGQRMQLAHAQQVLGRLRQRRMLQAWQAWQLRRAERQRQWVQLACRLKQRLLHRAFAVWQQEVAYQRGRREVLMRFVEERALGMMHHAFQFWRAYTAAKQERVYLLQQSVVRLSQRLLAGAWYAWRQHVAEAKVQRHRIAVCQRRQQANLLRAVLGAWRERADGRRVQQQAVQQGLKRSNRNRLVAAFRALQANVERARSRRELAVAAVQQYSMQLQSKGLLAWAEAVRARRSFEQQLCAVHQALQAQVLRAVLQGWRSAAQASIARQEQLAHAQHLLGKRRLRAALQAWRGYCSYQQHLKAQLQTLVQRRAEQLASTALYGWRACVAQRHLETERLWEATLRISQLRMAWVFRAWQQAAAQRTAARRAMQGAERRINRIKAAGAFRAWWQHTTALAEARVAAEQMAAVGSAALVQQCFAGWADYLARRAEQQEAVMCLVQRRAVWLMANVMQAWRSFVDHSAARRQQMRRVCCKLARVRLQQAFAAWRQRAAEQQARAANCQAVEKKMQVKRLARVFFAWAEHAADMRQAREAAGTVASNVQQRQLAAAFRGWQEVTALHRHARAVLGKLTIKTDRQLLAATFQTWRQGVHRSRRLRRLEGSLGSKRDKEALVATFQAWRQHTANIRGMRAAINSRHHAEAALLLRVSLRSWQKHTSQRRLHRVLVLEKCIDKQVVGLQASAFSAWRQYTQARQRATAVMMRAVDRLSMRLTRSAFEAWRDAAKARKARRTAITRFVQRWQLQRMQAAFWQWQHVLQERKAALDNLRRCLTRKRVAFKLFRTWYWESFDDEMQETLRTMFEITNEAAADPMPSRACSPISSLLSSPIRAQVHAYGATQHQQLADGVAHRLAQPGGLQPAFMRFQRDGSHPPEGQLPSESGIATSVHLQFGGGAGTAAPLQRQPLPPQPAPLHSRVTSARSSPVRPTHSSLPARVPPNLAGSVLAPLRDLATGSFGAGGGQLPPHHHSPSYSQPSVASPEKTGRQLVGSALGPSPYGRAVASPERPASALRQTPASPASGRQVSNGSVVSGSYSKAASTIVPRSPLTPTSEGYVGGTPMTHFATPNPDGMFTIDQLPGTLSASRAPRQQLSQYQQQQYQPGAGAGSPAELAGARLMESPATALTSSSLLHSQLHRSPSGLSEASTPASTAFTAGWGAAVAQATPLSLSQAHTPLDGATPASISPGSVAVEPTPDPNLGFAVSPAMMQQLVNAATPMGVMSELRGQYQLRRLSDAGQGLGGSAAVAFHTPQPAALSKTPPPGFPELQGDYSIRRLSAAAEQHARAAAEQGTPNPNEFIGAYPTANRSGRLSSDDAFSAAKTPIFVNPISWEESPREN